VIETLVPEVTNDPIEELDTTKGESVVDEDMIQKDILPNKIIKPPEVVITENVDHEQRVKIKEETNLLVDENNELDKAKSLCEINQTEQKKACPDIVTTEVTEEALIGANLQVAHEDSTVAKMEDTKANEKEPDKKEPFFIRHGGRVCCCRRSITRTNRKMCIKQKLFRKYSSFARF